jgi:hypothetical protein
MIMVFYGLAEGRKTKTPQASWRPAAICLVKVLSQPQVRANRVKPIKEILAAGCVVYLLAVHETKVTERNPQSSQGGGMAASWVDENRRGREMSPRKAHLLGMTNS